MSRGWLPGDPPDQPDIDGGDYLFEAYDMSTGLAVYEPEPIRADAELTARVLNTAGDYDNFAVRAIAI